MNTIQKEQTKKAIPGYCKLKGFTTYELAVKTGIAHSIIRNMYLGNWDDIDNRFWKRVWQEINPETMEGVYRTGDCKKVFNLCNSAIKYKRMIGLTGDTGMGKSTALRAYGIRANVFYYYIDTTVSPYVFLKGLLKEMGVGYEGNLNDMRDRVVYELNTLEEPLLIIDESGKLKDKMILLLHSIRDLTISNCGIVLAGMPNFKNGLIGKVNKGTTGYSEFYRRINMWDELNGLTWPEIALVLESNGITDKDAQKEFRKFTRFGDLMNAIDLHKTVNE